MVHPTAGSDPTTPFPAAFTALHIHREDYTTSQSPINSSAPDIEKRVEIGPRRSTVASAISQVTTLVGSDPNGLDAGRSPGNVLEEKQGVKVSVNSDSKDDPYVQQSSPYDNIVREEFNDFPFGASRLAAFLNTADSFTMSRRYGRAHCRILLDAQAELTKLIHKLDMCDLLILRMRENGISVVQSSTTEILTPDQEALLEQMRKQREILDELKKKLPEFDDLLLKYNQICRLYRPPDRAYAQVFHWMLGNKIRGSGHDEFDHDFINYRDDMVYVVDHQQQADGFDRIIEWCCRRWPASFLQWFLRSRRPERNTEEGDDGDDAGEPTSGRVIFFSSDKILLVGKMIAILLSVTILLLPVFLLSLVRMNTKVATTVVLVFVLAFVVMMSLLAGAKAEGVFISACAYCAVLVTFLGNVQGNGLPAVVN